MSIVEARRCPVCGAPLAGSAPRCAACGSLVAIRADHPPIDPSLLDQDVVRVRIEEFRARSGREPGDAGARYRLGVACFNLGLLEDAARELGAAADLMPENAGVQTGLAVVLADLGAVGTRGAERAALEVVGRALRLDPDEPEARLLLARLRAARGERAEAVEALRHAAAGGRDGVGARAALLLMAMAAPLAQSGRWLDAAALWREAVATDPEAAREPLLAILRDHRETLLSPPRWSWLVYPQQSGFERRLRYAAAMAFAALAALVGFILLGRNDATLLFGLVPCLLVVAAPVAIFLLGRRRLRERAAPFADLARTVRANPAAFFGGRPDAATLLAVAEYVAAEMQGAAIAGAHPWVVGRTSPTTHRAWRAATIRAPWLTRGGGDGR